MLFIAENDLEKALVAAVKDPAAAPEFYRLLLESDLLVLGSAEGQEDASQKFSLAPGGRLKLVTGQRDGNPYLPVFSSLARMQEFVKEESRYLAVKGRALLDVTRGGPVILNPASQYGKELSPQEVQQLLDGPAAGQIHAAQIAYPAALTAMLTALFDARPDVETAWMIQVTFAGQPPHPLVGIEMDSTKGGDWPSLMQVIQSAAENAVPGMVFDIQRVDPRNPTDLANALLQAPPFYQRRATGFPLN